MDYWIVVVDDEVLSLTNARNLLSEEQMRVSCLRSGADLLKYVSKNTPDLILLDILMPDMDGFETYNALRRFEDENGRSHIPVIFMTGENDSDTERRGLKAGASDFIRKPYNKDILIRRIHNTITNSRTIESLTEKATVDRLTGFLNKSSGTVKINRCCNDYSGALMIMDLDNFKLVNDLYGHDTGDKVLRAFADIVRHNVREADVVCRIGGDEFMAFFADVTEESAVSSLSNRLNQQFVEEAVRLMGPENGIPLGISIGVVMVPEHGRDYESLFALADSSLYTVKQNGKHGYYIYDQSEVRGDGIETDPEKEIERVTQIVEGRNDLKGALLLGREAFAMVYRFMVRFYGEYGGRYVRILFSLSQEGDVSERSLPEAASGFCDVLKEKLRRSDLIMQSRSDQFFVILNQRSETEAKEEISRILEAWNSTGYGKGIIVSHALRGMENDPQDNA